MSNNVSILVVEDEVLIAEYIKEILMDDGYDVLYTAYTIDKARACLHQFSPQIVLLDINVDGKDSGVEFAKTISEEVKVIYLTAQNDKDTIEKALATNPESYLTKPIKIPDLLASVQLASIKLKSNVVTIKDGYDTVKINYDQILFINSDRNYIDIFTTEKKITIRCTLDSFLSELDASVFKKVHRSYIVNVDKISKVSSASVFINDIEIPISKNCDVLI